MADSPDTSTVDPYIWLGRCFHALLWSHTTGCAHVRDNLNAAINLLDSLGFSYPKNRLVQIRDKVEAFVKQYPANNYLPQDVPHDLHTVMECIVESVKQQAEARRIILVRPTDVSERLRNLTGLDVPQTNLQTETIRCLECGAKRSAVIMGWCLGYDILRRWVFNDAGRKAKLNAEIAKIPKKRQITDYEDFFEGNAPGERSILDICGVAKIIGTKPLDDLRTLLRRRNEYAHANANDPTIDQVKAFIDSVLDIVTNLREPSG